MSSVTRAAASIVAVGLVAGSLIGSPAAAARPEGGPPEDLPYGGCAPPQAHAPTNDEIRDNSCRMVEAGGYLERRDYMLAGDESDVTSPEASEVGNTTWLTNHCVATLTDSAPPLAATTVDYHTVATFAFNDSPSKTTDDLTSTQKDDFRVKIRQEIKGADRVIHQSGETGDMFHRRLACSKDAAGAYDKIAVRFLNVYQDQGTDGVVNCSDVTEYLKKTAPYNDPQLRHMVYVHTSIDSKDTAHCNYKTGDTGYDPRPGVSNPANTTWSVALSENWEKDGITGYSVSTTNQELGHTHGNVAGAGCMDSDKSKCPPGIERTNDGVADSTPYPSHTYDFPDFMNGGGGAYYYNPGYQPPAGYRATANCESKSKTIFGTANDLWTGGFVDCGRDTYWNPAPATSNWLCTHYNYATDSPYFNKRYTRPLGCPAV